METSCKKNENVADAFEVLIEMTHRDMEKSKDKIEEDRISVVIDKKDYINTNKKKKKIDCC